MAVKMRLRREGKKKQPFYRVVIADIRSPRDGRFIEDIGYYQPLHEPSTIQIDRDRALYWLRHGAQPSDPVLRLLRIEGIWEEFRPGDPGKDRSEKHAKRAAAAARREEEARKAAQQAEPAPPAPEAEPAPPAPEAEPAPRAEAGAAAETQPEAEPPEEAVEEGTQPDAGEREETGPLGPAEAEKPEAAGETPQAGAEEEDEQ